jgi:hypothetical protein
MSLEVRQSTHQLCFCNPALICVFDSELKHEVLSAYELTGSCCELDVAFVERAEPHRTTVGVVSKRSRMSMDFKQACYSCLRHIETAVQSLRSIRNLSRGSSMLVVKS